MIERPADVHPEAILRVFRVPPEAAGMRLDRFLQGQLRSTSRTRAQVIVENSAFTPDGRRRRPSDRLKAEERVVLWRPPIDGDEGDAPLPILYEDSFLLVIDKPPLVTVHPTARHHRSTVIKRLEEQRPGEQLSLIHRLDRETSGILLVAKGAEADRAFKQVLEDRSLTMAAATRADQPPDKAVRRALARGHGPVHKTYLAITWGAPPNGDITLPLESDPDNPLKVKMRVAAPGQGLDAHTGIEVIDTLPGYALVACTLFTGRQHQIRVHLAAQGCPIVGDKLYGPDERLLARAADNELTDEDRAKLELPRHALHAHRYELPHPLKGERLSVEAPLPADLQSFWDSKRDRGAR